MQRLWAVVGVAALAVASLALQSRYSESEAVKPSSSVSSHSAIVNEEDFIGAAIASLRPEVTDPACHSKWHDVGRSIGSSGYTFPQLVLYQNYDGCNWGLVHGFVEGAMMGVTPTEFTSKAATVCGTDLTQRESVGNCLHGTGHAAWQASASELRESLNLCESLQVGSSDCADGVYMSLSDAVERGKWERDTLDICEETTNQEFRNKCYRYSGHIWSRALNGDAEAMLRNCPEGESECGLGVGRALAYRGKTASEVILNCRLAPNDSVRDGCAQGVSEWFALIRQTGQGDGDPSSVCEEMGPALYEEFREPCENGEKQR
jgi:hypothetical protein